VALAVVTSLPPLYPCRHSLDTPLISLLRVYMVKGTQQTPLRSASLCAVVDEAFVVGDKAFVVCLRHTTKMGILAV
jgi:hypothetical protein